MSKERFIDEVPNFAINSLPNQIGTIEFPINKVSMRLEKQRRACRGAAEGEIETAQGNAVEVSKTGYEGIAKQSTKPNICTRVQNIKT